MKTVFLEEHARGFSFSWVPQTNWLIVFALLIVSWISLYDKNQMSKAL